MTKADIIIITAYALGIVFGAIGFGVCTKKRTFDWWDDVIPFALILFMWPAVLLLAGGCLIVVGIGFVPCYLMECLMKFGGKIRYKWMEWKMKIRFKKDYWE